MSGNVQTYFSPSDLKEEKIETAAAEEFQFSECQTGPLHGSTFPLSTSPKSNWNSCLKAEDNPNAGDSESVPIYAASLLDPVFMELRGNMNGGKAEEDSSSLIHFSEESKNSRETAESLKHFRGSDSEHQERLRDTVDWGNFATWGNFAKMKRKMQNC